MPIFLNKTFKLTSFLIILAEFFSFFGYFYPLANKAGFLAIALITLILSFYKLEYGVLIMLAELFIGSKGYLFYFDAGGFSVSIRIALFIVVMAVWAGKIISGWTNRQRDLTSKLKVKPRSIFKSSYFPYFFILFISIGWGVINGFLNKNGFGNIFFDFNGWLYFLLIFPVYSVILNEVPPRDEVKDLVNIKRKTGSFAVAAQDDDKGVGHPMGCPTPCAVVAAAIFWLCLKTFFLLFIFSHASPETLYEIYRWVRTTGVGEITQIQGGFYRIFFQSHIFTLIGFFVLFVFLAQIKKETKSPIGDLVSSPQELGFTKSKDSEKPELNCGYPQLSSASKSTLFFAFFLLLSTVIVSFSRSFWVGLIFGIIFYFVILFFKKEKREIWRVSAIIFYSLIVSLFFIVLVVKFPYPRPLGGFDAAQVLSERASEIKGEAAVASRWELLPKLWTEIKKAPVLGKGFGAAVTYKSSDPRILEISPKGAYTAYAFEWGWLDVWLKMGFFGLTAYLFLIGKIVIDGLIKNLKIKDQNDNVKLKIIAGLSIGLAVVVIVNFFTPYLNHPLGIGYLILVSAILNKKRGA